MILYIVRGLPGSGKSTLAGKLAPKDCYSADDYFMHDGKYVYDKTKIGIAHNFCYGNVERAMKARKPFIAVANTFTTKREYKRYLKLSSRMGYTPLEIVCKGDYGNVHGVPKDAVERMRKRFQY